MLSRLVVLSHVFNCGIERGTEGWTDANFSHANGPPVVASSISCFRSSTTNGGSNPCIRTRVLDTKPPKRNEDNNVGMDIPSATQNYSLLPAIPDLGNPVVTDTLSKNERTPPTSAPL